MEVRAKSGQQNRNKQMIIGAPPGKMSTHGVCLHT